MLNKSEESNRTPKQTKQGCKQGCFCIQQHAESQLLVLPTLQEEANQRPLNYRCGRHFSWDHSINGFVKCKVGMPHLKSTCSEFVPTSFLFLCC